MTRNEEGGRSRRALKVLIIDDEPDVVTYLAAILEKGGHRAHVAPDGRKGFEVCKAVRPDVVCIDIMMPEETGLSLYRRIRSDDEVGDTPVIFVSALRPEAAHIDAAACNGGSSEREWYVEKPPDVEVFLDLVHKAARPRGGE
jgi:CheY-like chemotaxis protein